MDDAPKQGEVWALRAGISGVRNQVVVKLRKPSITGFQGKLYELVEPGETWLFKKVSTEWTKITKEALFTRIEGVVPANNNWNEFRTPPLSSSFLATRQAAFVKTDLSESSDESDEPSSAYNITCKELFEGVSQLLFADGGPKQGLMEESPLYSSSSFSSNEKSENPVYTMIEDIDFFFLCARPYPTVREIASSYTLYSDKHSAPSLRYPSEDKRATLQLVCCAPVYLWIEKARADHVRNYLRKIGRSVSETELKPEHLKKEHDRRFCNNNVKIANETLMDAICAARCKSIWVSEIGMKAPIEGFLRRVGRWFILSDEWNAVDHSLTIFTKEHLLVKLAHYPASDNPNCLTSEAAYAGFLVERFPHLYRLSKGQYGGLSWKIPDFHPSQYSGDLLFSRFLIYPIAIHEAKAADYPSHFQKSYPNTRSKRETRREKLRHQREQRGKSDVAATTMGIRFELTEWALAGNEGQLHLQPSLAFNSGSEPVRIYETLAALVEDWNEDIFFCTVPHEAYLEQFDILMEMCERAGTFRGGDDVRAASQVLDLEQCMSIHSASNFQWCNSNAAFSEEQFAFEKDLKESLKSNKIKKWKYLKRDMIDRVPEGGTSGSRGKQQPPGSANKRGRKRELERASYAPRGLTEIDKANLEVKISRSLFLTRHGHDFKATYGRQAYGLSDANKEVRVGNMAVRGPSPEAVVDKVIYYYGFNWYKYLKLNGEPLMEIK